MNVDPSGRFAFSSFLIIVGVSTLIGALCGGAAAANAGQNIWKGAAAGAIGGFLGGILSGLSGFFGYSFFFSLAGRAASSFAYSVTNEFFQTGSLNPSNLIPYALDAAEDTILSAIYFNATSALAGRLSTSFIDAKRIVSPNMQDVVNRSLSNGVSGVLDFKVDNLQATNHNLLLPQVMYFLLNIFENLLRISQMQKTAIMQ